MREIIKIRKVLFILVITIMALNGFSKSNYIDSLQLILKKAEEDTNRVNVLNLLCFNYGNINSKESFIYGIDALKLAKALRYKRGIANAYNYLGIFYYSNNNYSKAKYFYYKSLKIRTEIGDKNGIASIYNNIGLIYRENGYYTKALNCFLKSLKIIVELKDKQRTAFLYTNIGTLYHKQNNYKKALVYYSMNLKLRKELGDKSGIAAYYGNIGDIYSNQGEYNKALGCMFKALKIYKEYDFKFGEADIYLKLARVYCKLNSYRKALNYCNKSLEISSKKGDKVKTRNCFSVLQEIYRNLGDYKKAYIYYKLCNKYNDILSYKKYGSQIEKNKIEYEKQMKRIEIEHNRIKIKKQKFNNNIFLIGIIILLILSFMVFRMYFVIKRSNKIITQEKKKSDKLLLNILPSKKAAEFKKYGNIEAHKYDMVTVMFVDIKDFTKIAEMLTPEQLVGQLDYCYSNFDNIIGKYKRDRIEKIKTIGDVYICANGLPIPYTSNPVNVVNAALEILQFLETYRKKQEQIGELYFEVRIGIHTGSVIAGVVGEKKFAYDIWGDTVNLTSRMESNGEVGKINISGATYELVRDYFTCTHRGKIEVKNKGMMDMYFVEGVKNNFVQI